jgi:hypothetical protein
MSGQCVLNLLVRRRDDLRGMGPARFGLHGPFVDADHFEHVIEESRQPLHFGHHEVGLLLSIGLGEPRPSQVSGSDPDCGERRTQVVANRREQRRLQLLALAAQLGFPALFEQLGTHERLLGPGTRHCGEIASQQADAEKREQDDPVLCFGHEEGAERRQEKEVQAEHCRNGGDDGDP